MNYVVVFNRNNAFILRRIENIRPYCHMSNAVINPDISRVRRVHTQFWKRGRRGQIVPMTPREQKARLDYIQKTGLDMTFGPLPFYKIHRPLLAQKLAVLGACLATGGALLGYLI
jgi:hypothetical protein